MNDELERKLLLAEIKVLEGQIASSGFPDFPSGEEISRFPTPDLQALKDRLERLVRSLGGAKR